MKDSDQNYIIWLGSVFTDITVEKTVALSPAGNKWQLRFINALKKNSNFKVYTFGHRLEQSFPRGKLFVAAEKGVTPPGIDQKLSWYINLPYIRNFFINAVLLVKLIWLMITTKHRPQFIVSYNLYSYNFILPLFLKYITGVKWLVIVADPINDKTDDYNPLINLSDGNLYLSNYLYERSKAKNKIYIEGGVEQNALVEKNGKTYRYILYTGKISRHNGINLLIDAFKLLNDSELRLVITGKGENAGMLEAIKGNSRIIYKGVVDERSLTDLYANADILINPRLIDDKTNSAIFPSKILEYLSHRKPIISTYTAGINAEYNKVLKFIYADSPQELASLINEVLKWDADTLDDYLINLDTFSKEKTWDKAVQRFLLWAEKIHR